MSGRQAWSSSGLRASATPRRIQARPRGGSCQPSSQRSIHSPDGVPCDSHCSCGFLGVVATLLSVPDGDWTTAHSTREAHREELHRVRSRGLLARKHGASRSVSRSTWMHSKLTPCVPINAGAIRTSSLLRRGSARFDTIQLGPISCLCTIHYQDYDFVRFMIHMFQVPASWSINQSTSKAIQSLTRIGLCTELLSRVHGLHVDRQFAMGVLDMLGGMCQCKRESHLVAND